MIDIRDPFSKPELLQAIAEVNREVADYFGVLSAEVFFARFAEAWSPAENVVHLIKSVNPVAAAQKFPKLFLKLLFGTSPKPSRRFGAIKEDYRRVLAEGGKAPREYIPGVNAGPAPHLESQKEILKKWREVAARLPAALHDWNEHHLDKLRLPHPLLGKLTVREMILFTIYHNLHYLNNVRRRLGQEVLPI